ncbi:aromatic ring-hydroxylating dioxygenase subunit alpha [Nocardioides caldifontis]|uniref:aromatic ring-hydroxylating dioxygenase subunit alpha n=1 Tax=Nocardioides caldifontis TaxID=2588938 RepID=UPI0011DFBA2E|nr:Rieske 2Fe-2S domain-containing protein [Nocardioides caldifontis]
MRISTVPTSPADTTAQPRRRCVDVPHNAWYAAATSDEVGRAPLSRRMLGNRVVVYRTVAGDAVALEDRCAHRPVPLSSGRLEGDDIVAGYTGFRYAPDGRCVAVPTQANVPIGARVRAFPVHDDGSFVWVWTGDPNLARLRPPPQAPWLQDPEWVTFGDSWVTQAPLRLLLDNFSDITHVAHVRPEVAPPALVAGPMPPLEVTVSETGMSFARQYPPVPVPAWQAPMLGVPADEAYPQREEGEFLSPGLWVDRWHADTPEGRASFVFTHALTPVDETSTRHVWRVSRNFADSSAATGTLTPLMDGYYRAVREALEDMQRIVSEDGPRADVLVAADAAAVQVRRIMDRLVADETGTR